MIADANKLVVVGTSEVLPGSRVMAHQDRDVLLDYVEKKFMNNVGAQAVICDIGEERWREVGQYPVSARWCIAHLRDVRTGSDLPADQRELITCVSEECCEAAQVCSKILRFGLRVNPWNGLHNGRQLESELGDLLAVIIALCETGAIDLQRIHDACDKKLTALARPDGRLRCAEVKL